MRKTAIPDLTDIVSEGRNTAYGYYQIRKKYRKTLIISFLLALTILLLMVLIPMIYLYLDYSNPHLSEDEMVMVDYTFIPPPEDMPLVPPGPPPEPAPQQEKVKAPVVVDTVTEEKPEQKEPEPETNADTAGKNGTQAGPGTEEGTGEGIYTSLDVYPRFPGGEQARLTFLRYNIHYPPGAMKSLIQGIVKVVFVVEPDGSLSRFEISKGIGGGCDEEALRVARLMPRWEPGRRNGKTVKVLISMPIVFRLPTKPK